MRKLLTTVALGVLTLVGADLAYGQTLHRSFELTGFGGIRSYDKDVVFLGSGFVAGIGLSWFPTSNIGVEGTWSTSSADVDLSESSPEAVPFDDEVEEGVSVNVRELRINAVYQFLMKPDQVAVPYLSAGVGQLVFSSDEVEFNEPNTSFNWGGGVKIWLSEQIAIRVDARDNMAVVERPFRCSDCALPGSNTKTFQANNPEFTGAITIGFGGSEEGFGVRDSDLDGVPDKDDLCPNTPRGVIVDATGCPVDSDGDGVPDGLDACPNTPAGALVDERGCPLDSDNDGVFDGLDQCPNTPAGVQVDETGCPLPEPEPEACLGSQGWYTGDSTVSINGRNWVKFGAPEAKSAGDLSQISTYDGVPVYAASDSEEPHRELWMPLCSPAGSYQAYRLESEVRGTTGFIRDAN